MVIRQNDNHSLGLRGGVIGGLTELFRSIYVLSMLSNALCITYLQEFGKQQNDVIIGNNYQSL